MCFQCSRIWNTLPGTYSRNVSGLVQGMRALATVGIPVSHYPPQWRAYVPLRHHFARMLPFILPLDWSTKSQSLTQEYVNKLTACKSPKFLFALIGCIYNAISFQSRQGQCRCGFFALCFLQNGSHPVRFSVRLSIVSLHIDMQLQKFVGSFWTRCIHILSPFPEASGSNLSRTAGCPVRSFEFSRQILCYQVIGNLTSRQVSWGFLS